MLAISSGKGGVGKSTISANIAVALGNIGLKVGLMDTDIYGPNIPGILGSHDRPVTNPDTGQIKPIEAHNIKFISMGLLLEEGSPVIWRGPMLAKMINQFLSNVEWGELDILIADLPPGTGDVQLTLTQSAPLTSALILTTPSAIALEDVRRGVEMFRQAEVPILGLVENMSSFRCDACNHNEYLFGHGQSKSTAEELEIPFLCDIPIDIKLRECADNGQPAVFSQPTTAGSEAIINLAKIVIACLEEK
ncbi:MAG: Mrp/NBP35 family ATP-binding protein [Candidatus Latescibacterota bacterium]|nr:Mrp/NBP35 family ATP-binding protein [Candidatus Latescibacterota bacterium]